VTVVLATRNPGKIREIGAILSGLPIDLIALDRFPGIRQVVEDGATFEENASKKALCVRDQTGLLTVADDSGLEVEALGGRPGILSARFAGEHATHAENNAKLLGLLAGIPPERRGARFVCVAALAAPGGNLVLRRGEIAGHIAEQPSGSGGFGYDPVFFVPEFGRTMAELDEGIKNRISHRAKAFGEIARLLLSQMGPRPEGAEHT
jgi:XTP/dITP diphosphohydrolase